MSDIFETKTLKIGNSLGVLIPKRVADKIELAPGERVTLSIIGREKIRAIERTFGMAKGHKSFTRMDTLER